MNNDKSLLESLWGGGDSEDLILESYFEEDNTTNDIDDIVNESMLNLKLSDPMAALEGSTWDTFKAYFSSERSKGVKCLKAARKFIKKKEYDSAIKNLKEAKTHFESVRAKLNDLDDSFGDNFLDNLINNMLVPTSLIIRLSNVTGSGRLRAFGGNGEADYTEGIAKRLYRNRSKQSAIKGITFLIQSCDKTIISINKIKKGEKA